MAYNEIAFIKLTQGKFQDGIEILRKAIAYNEKADFKDDNIANLYVSLGSALKYLGKTEESLKYYNLAIEGYRRELDSRPDLLIIVRLGDVLTETGDFKEASVCFAKAVVLEPADLALHIRLIQSLQLQGNYDQAVSAAKNGAAIMQKYNKKEEIQKLNQIIETLESNKPK
jgi:tetratricopeptide (TPR) repeat protein